MKYKTFFLVLFIPFISLQAQTTKQEVMDNILRAGGSYYSYPTPNTKLTPAPKGYKLFYISHYGRHGSRYIASNDPYRNTIEKMTLAEKENKLTPLGKDVLRRLNIAYADAYRRECDLTRLGGRQHYGIASRMYRNFPELLSMPIDIDAKASIGMRCALSMSYFCQKLYMLNPKLRFTMDSSQRYVWYLANGCGDSIKAKAGDEEMHQKLINFKKKMHHSDRFMSELFTDSSYVKKNIDSFRMMDDLYGIAMNMQCLPELNLSFLDIFTKDELFDLWQSDNANWYYDEGFFPTCTPRYKSYYNLLRNILDTADKVIAAGKPTVTLRFGHDALIAGLTFAMKMKYCGNATEDIDNLYKHWANFKIIPMAANLQFIFYRNASNNDVLVKILHNENETSIPVKTDCAPYYHWKDVDAYYRSVLLNKNE
jgi:hypothetical protein